MSETAHTPCDGIVELTYWNYPGPWENSQTPTICEIDPDGGDPFIICDYSKVRDQAVFMKFLKAANIGAQADHVANASGDMLKALKNIVNASESRSGEPDTASTVIEHIARSAIAKATGGGDE